MQEHSALQQLNTDMNRWVTLATIEAPEEFVDWKNESLNDSFMKYKSIKISIFSKNNTLYISAVITPDEFMNTVPDNPFVIYGDILNGSDNDSSMISQWGIDLIYYYIGANVIPKIGKTVIYGQK